MKGITRNPFVTAMNHAILKIKSILNIQNGRNTGKAKETRVKKRMRKGETETVNNITFQENYVML